MLYEASGKVLVVGETQSFGSNGFKKRDIVIEIGAEDSKWKKPVSFTFKKDKTTLLDGLREGNQVTIKFDIDGRAWDDPKTGKTKYFTSLEGVRIEVVGASAKKSPAPAEPPAEGFGGDEGLDEMPF